MQEENKINKKEVRFISKDLIKDFILNIHYAHRMPSVSYAFGLFEDDELIGVCTYGTPASSTLLSGICGKDYKNIVKELNRLVLKYNRKNEASFFISKTLKMLPSPMIIVSYADTAQNHNGIVYQAANFIYTGLSSKFKDPKIKGLEHQHHATYAHGLTNKQLKEKYGDKLYFINRSRKHRYVYFLGNKSEKKRMMKSLRYKIQKYPKFLNNENQKQYCEIAKNRIENINSDLFNNKIENEKLF